MVHGSNTMKVLRDTNDYSQEDVASALGISQNSYSRLETGKTKLTMERVKKLAKLYNVEAELFLSDRVSAIHLNHGTGSHSNSGFIQSYNHGHGLKEFYERLLNEKEERIKFLEEELSKLHREWEQFIKITADKSKS